VTLRVRGLAVRLGGREIVTDVDLDVPDGRFVGLVGPNGSGKSTLLRALYRAVPPSAGTVTVDDGVDLLALRPTDAARRVAVLTQDNALDFDVTAAEFVAVGRTPWAGRLRDSAADRDAVHDALARVDATHLAHRSLTTMSGGERQRVYLARALAQGCDHLLLDEPTNHLDVRFQVELLELVAGLGVGVLAALHDLSLAALFCDTVHVLDTGRVHASGPPADVLTAETVRHVFGASTVAVTHPQTGRPALLACRTSGQTDKRS
jgi:iron complex transport system ATP-binding protein